MPIPLIPLAAGALGALGGFAAGSGGSSGRGGRGAGNFFTGTPASTERFNVFTRPQQNLQNQIIAQALQNLGHLGQPSQQVTPLGALPPALPIPNLAPLNQQADYSFDPIEQEYRRKFQQEGLPSLAERFAGLGGLRSGSFAQALGGAQAGLESQLAALKSKYNMAQRHQTFQELQAQNEQALARQQQQAAQQLSRGQYGLDRYRIQAGLGQGQQQFNLDALSRLLQLGLQPSFNTAAYPAQPGFLETGLSSILSNLGNIARFGFGL